MTAHVISVTEIAQPRSFKMDYRLRRSYTRSFRVIFDDVVQEGLAAAVACGINFGDIYRTQLSSLDGTFIYDTGVIAYEVDAKPETDDIYTVWMVNWKYDSQPGNDPALFSTTLGAGASTAGGGGANERPELEPTKFFFGKLPNKRAIYQSNDDPPKRFANSAGTPFKTGPEIDQGLLTITVVRNEIFAATRSGQVAQMLEYKNYFDKTNLDPFLGLLPGLVKCESITSSEEYRNKVKYFQVTFVFHVQSDIVGWHWRPAQKGPMFLSVIDDSQQQAVEIAGHPKEVFLSDDGHLLPDGDDPVLSDFTIYDSINFYPLGIV